LPLLRLFALVLLLFNAAHAQAPEQQLPLSTVEEIAKEFQKVPCRNADRLNAVKALFEKMQAPPSAISVESFDGVENVVVRHEGTSKEVVVLGAHYDVAERGCGAVDNWSGIVALAHLYKTIRAFKTTKTVIFAAFGKEELGLLGSKAMVRAIPKEQLPDYCAMINIDSFGLADPFALKGSSSKKLMALADEVARAGQVSFAKIDLNGDSDSSSFNFRRIPAITLSGLSSDWESIIHTTADQPDKVNPLSVYIGYRFALAMWARVEQAACSSFR
jgi:Zn-dependent M28 family amino/carboxypeptidase